MTNYQLLIPRFKCIQDFWNNPFKVGQIITINFKPKEATNEFISDWYHTDLKEIPLMGETIPIKLFRDFQNLFQELNWYEERKMEDMPSFIKDDKGVFKVYKHFTYILNDEEHKAESIFSMETRGEKDGENWRRYDECLPATEEEYNQQFEQRNYKTPPPIDKVKEWVDKQGRDQANGIYNAALTQHKKDYPDINPDPNSFTKEENK